MSTAHTVRPELHADVDTRRPVKLSTRGGTSDVVFAALARGSGATVLAIMSMVGLFLTLRALDAIGDAGPRFLTTQMWEPDSHRFGIAAVLSGTILIGLTAISVALVLSLGIALYISEYAPPLVKRVLIGLVDLMAAVPSVVFGLWGAFWLQGNILGVSRWMATWFGWIPIFGIENVNPTDPLAPETVFKSSTFIAGLVVGMMITPITSSVMREAFMQAPVGEREGAFALGATRLGMIRSVVLPYGRGGIIGGTMLGLGRALGETIAVYMIISPEFRIQWHVLQKGSNSVSALIALRYGEANALSLSALFAAGLALFLLTLVINFAAASVVARSRSGAGSEG